MPTSLPPVALATDRRGLLKAGALGLAGIALPLSAAEGPKGFTHGVASGEPGDRQVLLWTRYVGGVDTRLGFEVAETLDFARIVASGEALASPQRDWCAKAKATALEPGKWYYYRFIAPSGERSVIGRTRTMPVGKLASFKLAVFSCSNLGFGWFNAYAHAAEAGEFDLAVHLGDYYYEYKRGTYPSAQQALAGRLLWPEHEAVLLADYRERHANYRADPDLQRLHQLLPWVVMWDDHEVANDSWKDGAENHQPATEGDYAARKAASERAFREWLPVSDDDWASYEIGDLATLFRLESRHVARTQPLDLLKAGDVPPDQAEAALIAFRDGSWRDPTHTLLGQTQESWLAAGLKRSVRARKPWQVLGQQIVMGSLAMPDAVAETMRATTADWLKRRIHNTVAAAHVGLPFNMDAWDGYPAARDRLLQSALAADANLLVLSGDSHNAWAFDLDRKGARVGVEMASQSVTSPGAEGTLNWMKPEDLAAALYTRNPQLKWADTARRGYLAVELTPASATGEWRFMSSVRQKGTALSGTRRMTVMAGQRRFVAT
ncbi:MAG TPA: alkaline phosphatase D family protein [Novosphingobium sp.]|nr:alkaline phosphatase D family protein [Novosphingobium sp.]